MKKEYEAAVEIPDAEGDVAAVETPRGREGVLTKFKKANPDFEGEPTDEELWEFAGGDYDTLKSNHRKVMESHKGLIDYTTRDPRFGAAIGMSFGEGDDKIPLMQALGRLYGPDSFNDSEEFMKGVEEFNERATRTQQEQDQANKNFYELTAPRIVKFAEENNLTDEQFDAVKDGLFELGSGMLMGDISLELIEMVYKGLNYDTDVEEAAITGEIEGKNTKIRAELEKRTPQDGIVDLGSGTGAMGAKRRVEPEEKKRSFIDSLEDVE